jgi:hypothetical protein|tara:strand:+ start:255 stop:515 length:261 start_codon:yes stop_codon:yes gene_type:complete
MADFGKMIDKLIEISTNEDMSQEVKLQLDDVIEELIHLEIEKNGNVVPDLNELDSLSESLSPEELEEIKLFEMFVRDVMDNKLAMA